MQKIIFIGEYKFPCDYASSNRVLYMAQCAKLAGYEPFVIGKGAMDGYDKVGQYKGIAHTSMQPKPVVRWKKALLFIQRHFVYKSTLKKYISESNVKAVIIYASASARYVPQVIKLCRKLGVKCICDISEWYDKKQFKHGETDINFRIFTYMFNNWFEKAKNIICCSELVYKHFEKKGCKCLKINGILDINEYQPKLDITKVNTRTLIYSGVAGKKDHLLELFRAFDELTDEEKKRLRIKIVGMDFKYMEDLFGEFGYSLKFQPEIEILGRKPKDELTEHIKEASYSVLFRPNERYANAGFPSKVPESMALGTPMFCNLTSDLGDYLKDENAVVLDNCSKESILKEIREKVLKLSNEEIITQKKAAYETAKSSFDINVFKDEFRHFIDE